MAGHDTELSPDRVQALVADGASLIDVRRPDEVAAARIEDSRHIELAEVAGQAASIDKDTPVIFYCRVGARSALAVDAFRTGGYEAYNLAGGIESWIEAGLPVAGSN